MEFTIFFLLHKGVCFFSFGHKTYSGSQCSLSCKIRVGPCTERYTFCSCFPLFYRPKYIRKCQEHFIQPWHFYAGAQISTKFYFSKRPKNKGCGLGTNSYLPHFFPNLAQTWPIHFLDALYVI